MDSKVMVWIQLITAMAVLVGLGLVVWELQQTRTLVRAQLANANLDALSENSRAQLSETFANVRAKACFEPEKLTDGELMEMYEYHALLLASINRLRLSQTIAGFDYAWEDYAVEPLRLWLESPVGKADFESSKDTLHADIRRIAEALLREGKIEDCRETYGRFFDRVRNAREGNENDA